ncbi:MAG TPA: acyl carrier protein [Kofleriaceae bacterium]|jgi:acyl carrier protein|nr:acyl carrier protein [Kofleriaceae bacterium]
MHDEHTDPHCHLRNFIVTNFYIPDGQPLDEVTSFLDAGIIDSTGVLELVAHVETEYGITIADHELIPSNFDSIGALARFIERKRGSDGGRHDRLAR